MTMLLQERAENYTLHEFLTICGASDTYPLGFALPFIVNHFAQNLSEYFLSCDKEPRVIAGRIGTGKTHTYMEALMATISQNSEFLPSAILYKNFNARRLLDHRKLASEEVWGASRLGIIDANKHSISEMIAASTVIVHDDMGYIFGDVINGNYELRQLNEDLEEILYNINNGKKVVIITDNPFGLYAEKIEEVYLKRGLPSDDIKRLNDLLPKFGDRNLLHREKYRDVSHMAYVDFFPQAIVSRMDSYFKRNKFVTGDIRTKRVYYSDDHGVRHDRLVRSYHRSEYDDSPSGLLFLYRQISNPRRFVAIVNYILEKKLKERKTEEESLEVTSKDILTTLRKFGIKVKGEKAIRQ